MECSNHVDTNNTFPSSYFPFLSLALPIPLCVPRPQCEVHLVDVLVQARHAALHEDSLVLHVDPDAEKDPDRIIAVLKVRTQRLLKVTWLVFLSFIDNPSHIDSNI